MAIRLTHDLATFVATLKFTAIPRPVVERITVAFADCVGVMIAGAVEPAPQLLRSVLSSGGNEAILAGSAAHASALDAAFINGAAAHALDFDDDAQRGGHVSAVLVPAILADAQALGSSGERMVVAYAAGYEVLAELIWRDPGQHHEKGWHPTGVFGAVAAAAACASLRGLDATRAAMAIALSASQSAGLIANVGTMTKPFHAGHAAHAGVLSARLAQAGFTAADDALEHLPGFLGAFSPGGPIDLETPVSVGREWRFCGSNQLGTKQYPLCYYTHRCIDATLDMITAHPLLAQDIERITVSISPRNARILRYDRPQTGLEAKFSIQFAVAASILAGHPGLEQVTDAFVRRPDVQALMQRVVVRIEERDDPKLPGYAIYDQVIVDLCDGRRIESARVNTIRGGPALPLSRGALFTKFEGCLRYAGRPEGARALFDALMSLDELSDAREIARLMAPVVGAHVERVA
jgi:2-methylcitrate dehydratase PrpD